MAETDRMTRGWRDRLRQGCRIAGHVPEEVDWLVQDPPHPFNHNMASFVPIMAVESCQRGVPRARGAPSLPPTLAGTRCHVMPSLAYSLPGYG